MAGYKINSQKSVALLYTKEREAEQEIRGTSPFTIATYSIKYLGVTNESPFFLPEFTIVFPA